MRGRRTVTRKSCSRVGVTTAILCLVFTTTNSQQAGSVEPNLQSNSSAKTKEEAQAEHEEVESEMKHFNDMRQRMRRKSMDEVVQQFYTSYDGAFLPEAQMRHVSLKYLYLQNANLQRADLSKARLNRVSLTEANLQGADFSFAEFSVVNLKGARLEGAMFGNASISRVNLYGAKINEATNFNDFEWWKASFVGKDKTDLDIDLVKKIYNKYGSSVPHDLSAVHDGIREHIATMKREKSSNGAPIN